MHDFTAMVFFVHVAEKGSFTAAARHIGQPLSTVSRRIAELEESLGARLLERSTRSVRLTELGADYYNFCRRGLQEFDSANLMLQNRQSEVSGLVRITVPPSLVEPFFVPLVTKFMNAYPNARVVIMSTQRHVDLLNENIDIGFRVGSLSDSSLTTRKIATYTDHLVAAPNYVEGRMPISTPADLSGHRAITFGTDGAPVCWTLDRQGDNGKIEAVSVTLVSHLQLNDFAAIHAATMSGSGISRIPSILCAKSLYEGGLVKVLPEWSFEPVSLSAITLGTRNMSRLIRLFLDQCVSELPDQLTAVENFS